MINLNMHIGYVETTQPIDGLLLKPFSVDLTKYPSLFINRDKAQNISENDPVTLGIIEQAKALDAKEKYLKTVIIDNGLVAYCSAIPEHYYRKKDPEMMMKRLCGTVNKIYDEYLHNDDFVPYIKYLIVVKDTKGLEQYLVDIMSKIGPLGVYLVFAGDYELLEDYEHIKSYLFGQITYIDDYCGRDINVWCGPRYELLLERFRPNHERSPIIFPDCFYRRARRYDDSLRSDLFS